MDDQHQRNGERMPTRAEVQVGANVRHGEPDDLLGAHDPDWWVRRMARSERITGVLPPGLSLRTEDARLEEALDRESSEEGVRTIIEEFNRRVVRARRHLRGGPPVITPTRDPDREVELWRERRGA